MRKFEFTVPLLNDRYPGFLACKETDDDYANRYYVFIYNCFVGELNFNDGWTYTPTGKIFSFSKDEIYRLERYLTRIIKPFMVFA